MPGTVIDGFVSVPNGTNESTVVIPPNLTGRDIVHQTPSNFYAFVICNDLLYFCNLIELLDGNGNWTVSTGSSGNDLDSEGICEMVCNVSECNGAVEFDEIPLDDVCDYTICYVGLPNSDSLVLDNIIVDGISLNEESGFDFPYCWDYNYSLDECNYTGEFSCPNNLPCVTDLVDDLAAWLTLNGYIFEDIVIEWDRGLWCLRIIQTDADFEEAYFNFDAYDVIVEEIVYNIDGTIDEYIYDTVYIGEQNFSYTLEGELCSDILQKIIAIPHACEDPEFLWSDNSHGTYIIEDEGSLYSVTVTCDDGCEYENGGYVEPPSISGGEELEVRSSKDNTRRTLSLKVFPNPAKDKVFIEVNSSINGEHQLTVTSINGAMSYMEKFINKGELRILTIDLKSVPAGIFLVKVTAGDVYKIEKFVVVK